MAPITLEQMTLSSIKPMPDNDIMDTMELRVTLSSSEIHPKTFLECIPPSNAFLVISTNTPHPEIESYLDEL